MPPSHSCEDQKNVSWHGQMSPGMGQNLPTVNPRHSPVLPNTNASAGAVSGAFTYRHQLFWVAVSDDSAGYHRVVLPEYQPPKLPTGPTVVAFTREECPCVKQLGWPRLHPCHRLWAPLSIFLCERGGEWLAWLTVGSVPGLQRAPESLQSWENLCGGASLLGSSSSAGRFWAW